MNANSRNHKSNGKKNWFDSMRDWKINDSIFLVYFSSALVYRNQLINVTNFSFLFLFSTYVLLLFHDIFIFIQYPFFCFLLWIHSNYAIFYLCMCHGITYVDSGHEINMIRAARVQTIKYCLQTIACHKMAKIIRNWIWFGQ